MTFRSVSWRIQRGAAIAYMADVESMAWTCPAVSALARSAALVAPRRSQHVMTRMGASPRTPSAAVVSVDASTQLTTHLELDASAQGA